MSKTPLSDILVWRYGQTLDLSALLNIVRTREKPSSAIPLKDPV